MVWRTMLITMSTCFLLGTTFTHWIADHNILWRSPVTSEATEAAIRYYSLFASAPVGLGWAYIAMGTLAVLSAGGRLLKGWQRGSEVVFDGGSVVLLAAITYTQVNDVFPTIELIPGPLPSKLQSHKMYDTFAMAVRDLAADNVITAVMLTGIVLLQAGRSYARRPIRYAEEEIEESGPSTPPSGSEYEKPPSPLTRRAQTPFRELTEAEAMELR